MHPDPILPEISDWFAQAIPNPDTKSLHTQLGVHFEEVAEMLEALESDDEGTIELLTDATQIMKALSARLKTNADIIGIGPDNRVPLLDSLCDQIVTAVGVGYMMNFDLMPALEEVSASNWSKFVNGKPIFDENMKIQKGPSYFKPDLKLFV